MKRACQKETEAVVVSPAPNDLDGGEDDAKNPLLNHVIMDVFFKAIPFNFKDFKNFRLVSKMWLKASESRWRQEAWLHVNAGVNRDGNLSLQKYLNMLTMPGNPHKLYGKNSFRKHKLSGGVACKLEIFGERSLLQFWSKVGPSITHLNMIYVGEYAEINVITRVLFEMIPNLKFLSLNGCITGFWHIPPYPLTRDETIQVNVPAWNNRLLPSPSEVQRNMTHFEINWRESQFKISWMYFFLRFPNLKRLKLQEIPFKQIVSGGRVGRERVEDELIKFFESLQTVRANGGEEIMSQLEHLDLLHLKTEACNIFRPVVVEILDQLAFPLSSLSIDIGYDQDVAGFKRILKLYSKTLKELLIYRGPYEVPFPEDFPYGVDLPHLEVLTVVGPICGNLRFLSNTPCLKTLVLLDGQTELREDEASYCNLPLSHLNRKKFYTWRKPLSNKVDLIAATNFSSEAMQTLVLPQMEELIVGYKLCGGDDVEALGKLMPGLKKLRLGLGNDGFKMVCKNWGQLRHLDIDPFDVEEAGILGIDDDGKKYSQPNLTNLKRLTSLRMGVDSNNDPKQGGLTNASIVDGLLVAESLTKVTFDREPQASPKIYKMLVSKFPQ